MAKPAGEKVPTQMQDKFGACGIVPALGMVNFLYDSSQTPHIKSSEIYKYFCVAESTVQGKSKAIRDVMKMSYYDTNWCLPSRLDRHPTAWLISVNGFPLDARYAPRAIQEEAFRKGLIPYLLSSSDSGERNL